MGQKLIPSADRVAAFHRLTDYNQAPTAVPVYARDASGKNCAHPQTGSGKERRGKFKKVPHWNKTEWVFFKAASGRVRQDGKLICIKRLNSS